MLNDDQTSKSAEKTPIRSEKNGSVNNCNSNVIKNRSKCKNIYSERPEYDVYDSEPPSPKPISIDDIKYASQKCQQKKVEKEAEAEARKELAERKERNMAADKLREEKFAEATRAAEKSLMERMIESENFILQAVADVERLEQEFEAEQQQKLEEMKRREMDLKERSKILSKFRAVHALFKQGIERFMKAFTDMDKDLQNAFVEFKSAALQIIRAFESVVQTISPQNLLDQETVNIAEKYQKDMDLITNDMISKFNEIKVAEQQAKEAEEQQWKQEQAALVQQQQQQQKEAEAAAALASMTNAQVNEARDAVDNPPIHALKQHDQSRQRYDAIMTVYRRNSEEIKKLSEDPRTKDFRMNCQKAVNTPINAISANSPDFLLDKYRKLEALLREETVTVGNNQVSVKAHPLGKLYVTLLISRKFVNQADTIMTSAAKAEFPLAAVVVALWTKFPEVGQFFMAYLYKDCPYFVPYFLPQVQGQSDEDYMK